MAKHYPVFQFAAAANLTPFEISEPHSPETEEIPGYTPINRIRNYWNQAGGHRKISPAENNGYYPLPIGNHQPHASTAVEPALSTPEPTVSSPHETPKTDAPCVVAAIEPQQEAVDTAPTQTGANPPMTALAHSQEKKNQAARPAVFEPNGWAIDLTMKFLRDAGLDYAGQIIRTLESHGPNKVDEPVEALEELERAISQAHGTVQKTVDFYAAQLRPAPETMPSQPVHIELQKGADHQGQRSVPVCENFMVFAKQLDAALRLVMRPDVTRQDVSQANDLWEQAQELLRKKKPHGINRFFVDIALTENQLPEVVARMLEDYPDLFENLIQEISGLPAKEKAQPFLVRLLEGVDQAIEHAAREAAANEKKNRKARKKAQAGHLNGQA